MGPIAPPVINIFDGIVLFAMLGIFSMGKQVLDVEEVTSKLRLGLDDLSNADTRTLGLNRMPDITLETAETAYQILSALDPKEKE